MIQGSFYSSIMNKDWEQVGLGSFPHSNHFSGLHGNPQLQRSRRDLVLVSIGRNNGPIYAGTELSLREPGPKTFTQVTTLVTCPYISLEGATESSARIQRMWGSGIWEGVRREHLASLLTEQGGSDISASITFHMLISLSLIALPFVQSWISSFRRIQSKNVLNILACLLTLLLKKNDNNCKT